MARLTTKEKEMSSINETTARLIIAMALYHECTPIEFVDALVGVAWNEETAGGIKRLINN